MSVQLDRVILGRIEALGRITDEPGRLTRTFCSPAMKRAHRLVSGWMKEAGMTVRMDAIGNLIGHYAQEGPKSAIRGQGRTHRKEPQVFILGSHLDTVRDAGKFDGPLGVICAIACVEQLRSQGIRLPFAVEVVGFADEEGLRYQTAYLGSKVMAGTFNKADLKRRDEAGISMEEAIRGFGGNPSALKQSRIDPKRVLGYAEIHIEQGPVLERNGLALGVVTGIAGQTRARIRFAGQAGHAGTVPMTMRHDALCAASAFILKVENHARKSKGLVATVGQIAVQPGASNVIPGEADLTLDVRHLQDAVRLKSIAVLQDTAKKIDGFRRQNSKWQTIQNTASVKCDGRLVSMLDRSVRRCQGKTILLASGAGHDAVAMSAIAPVVMLFVRCKGGVSHNPAESVSVGDMRAALAVMNDFLLKLAGEV